MGAKLTSNVHVVIDAEKGESKWFGPDYPANGDPPEGSVTNPAAFEPVTKGADLRFRADDFDASGDEPRNLRESEAAVGVTGEDGRPPKGGPGSGADVWRAYAESRGITVADGATKADIIAAVEAADS